MRSQLFKVCARESLRGGGTGGGGEEGRKVTLNLMEEEEEEERCVAREDRALSRRVLIKQSETESFLPAPPVKDI